VTPPHWYEILLGCFAVIAACGVAAWAFWYGFRDGNWLLHIVGAGSTIFAAGVVGQRAPADITGRPASIWDASIGLPGIPITISQVTVAGLLVILLGLSLVLFLERVVPPEERWQPPPPRPLEDDDSV
jgi:hypothetical protein